MRGGADEYYILSWCDQTFKESENKTKDLQERLNAALREKDILEERVRELETEEAAQREVSGMMCVAVLAKGDETLYVFQDWRRRESESIEKQKRSAGEEQVGAALDPPDQCGCGSDKLCCMCLSSYQPSWRTQGRQPGC